MERGRPRLCHVSSLVLFPRWALLPPQRLLRGRAFALFAARLRRDLFQLHRLQRRQRIILAPLAQIVERAAVFLQTPIHLDEKLIFPLRIIDRAFAWVLLDLAPGASPARIEA